tara:strand:+ start:171899 stop:173164 length:1266 start_codon:yes stop_codon:yes gene_type:complete
MKKLFSYLTLLCIVGTLPVLSGCGKPAEQAGQKAAEAAEAAEAAKTLDPAESMQVMMDGISNQKLEAFWNFLPASYQKQLNDQSHELAAKMDPEMYDGIFNSGQRLTKLLKEKKEFILKNPTIKGLPVPQEKVDEFWEPTVNILSTIVNGEISSVEKLKTLDFEKFLSNDGGVILKNVFAISELIPSKEGQLSFAEKLKQTKVTLVSTEGDTAIVKIEAPGEVPREQTMVKVEEKWIPDNLAKSWKTQMDETRKRISEFTPEMTAEQKKKVMPALQKFDATIAQLENAKTEEEFNKTLSPILAPVAMLAPMMMMQLGGQPMMGGPGNPSLGENEPVDPNSIVTIVIAKKLSNEEQDPIIEQILLSADDSDQIRISPISEGETTIFKISPVGDVEEFAKKIKFGKTTKIDPKTRSITVELNK